MPFLCIILQLFCLQKCPARLRATTPHRCIPKECSRVVIDDFITPSEVTEMLRIVDIGMAYSSESARTGGPTIMDLNTGYLRDTSELKNIYTSDSKPAFTAKDFSVYKVRISLDFGICLTAFASQGVIERIHEQIKLEFGIEQVYFTAPTFVTREVSTCISVGIG